ncbi:hypothetical protein GGR52DRAFT_533633 [Hypoxylon sp. FL1284]|nr:hypothetical protein GGR52DRAFT_533633 [Hypoxylon sp. FL1284]
MPMFNCNCYLIVLLYLLSIILGIITPPGQLFLAYSQASRTLLINAIVPLCFINNCRVFLVWG